MNRARFRKALFLAPLAGPIVYILVVIICIAWAPKQVMTDILGLIYYGAYALPMGYFGALIIAALVATLLRMADRLSLPFLLLTGAIAGALFFPLIVRLITHSSLSDIQWFLGAGGAMGLAVAYVLARLSGLLKHAVQK